MTSERATGLVLRLRPLTETSLIVHWLTAEAGRLATVAKGARRPKSPFRGKLDLYFDASFSFHRSPRSDLHTLREVVLLNPRPQLRTSLASLRRAAYATLLVERTTETSTPIPTVHSLLAAFLDAASRPLDVLAFELQLLADAGLAPDLDATRLSPETRELAATLAQPPLTGIATLDPPPRPFRELQAFLHGFLIYHLGGLPRGRAAALETDPDPPRTTPPSDPLENHPGPPESPDTPTPTPTPCNSMKSSSNAGSSAGPFASPTENHSG